VRLPPITSITAIMPGVISGRKPELGYTGIRYAPIKERLFQRQHAINFAIIKTPLIRFTLFYMTR